MARKSAVATVSAALAVLAASPAWAHTPGLARDDFMSGFLHPLTGVDHVLAMVAVGVWAAMQGGRRVWQLPLAFMGVMVVGGIVGFVGLPMFGVEQGIALSVLVLGLMIAVSARLPEVASIALVAAFALFHGHAHGTEFVAGASPVAYASGFVIATGLLHAMGIGGGLLLGKRSMWVPRLAGGAIALAGVVLLLQTF
ncbi:MAG TPA: HupE/UreJ family protein [bacterium]